MARKIAALSALTPSMRSLEGNIADVPNNPYLGFLDRFRVTYENELEAFVSLASVGPLESRSSETPWQRC